MKNLKSFVTGVFILVCVLSASAQDISIIDARAHYMTEVENSPLRFVNYYVTVQVPVFYSSFNEANDSILVFNIVKSEPFIFYSQEELDDWWRDFSNTVKLHYEMWLRENEKRGFSY